MKKESKNKKTIYTTIISSILLLFLVSIAFYLTSLSNSNKETVKANTSTISITYTDCASTKQSDCTNINKNLKPGESVSKSFKIQNTGTVPANYKVIFKELTNTFLNNELVYKVVDLNDNVVQGETPVPYASNMKQNINLFLGTILANETKEFKVVITFKETPDDQENNKSSSYNIRLGLTTQNKGSDSIYNLVSGASGISTDVITKPAPEGSSCTNTLAYDGTIDNNLRYVGANPCNYVLFNNELWRIIGIMNNVDDGTGVLETRIKLVRKDSLGSYSWDTSDSSVNQGYGINDWTQADLMQELNVDYLNTGLNANTTWYNGRNNGKTEVFDYTKVLTNNSQELIGNAKWYLGKIDGTNVRNANASGLYALERTPNNSFGVYDWTGRVALIYVSDYAFSVGGENRSSCITGKTVEYNLNCKSYTWILYTSLDSWTISPGADEYPGSIIVYYRGGNIDASYFSYYRNSVKPSLYLKSSIQIIGGNGSEESPYIIS